MICPNCSREIIDGVAFCGYCGNNLQGPVQEGPGPQPPPRQCLCCGNVLAEESRFCSKCGAAVGALPPVGAAPFAPPPSPGGAAQFGPPPPPPSSISPPSPPPLQPGQVMGKKKKGKGKLIALLVVLVLLGAGATAGYVAVSRGWDIQSVLPAFLHWDRAGGASQESSSVPEDIDREAGKEGKSSSSQGNSQSSSQSSSQAIPASFIAGYWRGETNDADLAGIFWHFREDGMVDLYYDGDAAELLGEENVWTWWYTYDEEEKILYIYGVDEDMEDSGEEITWDGSDIFTLVPMDEADMDYKWIRITKNDIPPTAVRMTTD